MTEIWLLVLFPMCNVCTPILVEFKTEQECIAAATKVRGGWDKPFCIGPTKGRAQ